MVLPGNRVLQGHGKRTAQSKNRRPPTHFLAEARRLQYSHRGLPSEPWRVQLSDTCLSRGKPFFGAAIVRIVLYVVIGNSRRRNQRPLLVPVVVAVRLYDGRATPALASRVSEAEPVLLVDDLVVPTRVLRDGKKLGSRIAARVLLHGLPRRRGLARVVDAVTAVPVHEEDVSNDASARGLLKTLARSAAAGLALAAVTGSTVRMLTMAAGRLRPADRGGLRIYSSSSS
jgi:hypothetical protein